MHDRIRTRFSTARRSLTAHQFASRAKLGSTAGPLCSLIRSSSDGAPGAHTERVEDDVGLGPRERRCIERGTHDLRGEGHFKPPEIGLNGLTSCVQSCNIVAVTATSF